MAATKDEGQPRYKQTYFYPPLSQHEHFRNWSQVKRRMEAYNEILGKSAAADAIVASLLEDQQQDELYTRLMALGYCFDQQKKMDVAGEVFDKLRATGDLASTILAADLLLKTVMGTGNDRGGNKILATFPDDLCDRAAGLLDHPDPVVQAIAEWMLSLRFKKQNRMTNRIPELFSSADRQKPWFRKWWSRKAECHLDDDYCRQLVQLNRHRTLQNLAVEVDKIEDRMSRLLAAPGSDAEQAVQQQVAFRDALTDDSRRHRGERPAGGSSGLPGPAPDRSPNHRRLPSGIPARRYRLHDQPSHPGRRLECQHGGHRRYQPPRR